MNDPKPNLVQQYQSLVVIWAALLMSQLMFLVILFFIKGELFEFRFDQPIAGPIWAMTVGFAVAAATCVGLSFALKRRFFERAITRQDTALVQTGLIIALALCEASSLIGMCLALAFDYQYFFAWFAVGIAGMLLHFPKQNDLLAAGYKASNPRSL